MLTTLSACVWALLIFALIATPLEWKVNGEVVHHGRLASVVGGSLFVLILSIIGYFVGGFFLLPLKALFF